MKTLVGVVVLWVLVCLSGCSNGIDGLEEIPTDGLCFAAAECSPAAAASAACERGQCIYTCEPDFSDGNDDLEEGEAGDGCECGPVEICDDGIDNDCDGQIDDGCPVCVETDEVCDGEDNDCDNRIDEGVTNLCGGCELVADNPLCDGRDNDCDNQIDEAEETPDSELLNVCGGCDQFAGNEQVGLGCDAVNDGCLVCDEGGSGVLTCVEGSRRTFFVDRDGDGFGDAAQGFESHCEPASGFSRDAGDCDDQSDEAFGANPVAQEVCNGRDDNCDGNVDARRLANPVDTVELGEQAVASQFAPEVAVLSDNSTFAAVWLENVIRFDGEDGIFNRRKLVVRRFDARESFPLSTTDESFVVATGPISSPRIAALASNKFALAWLEGSGQSKTIKRATLDLSNNDFRIIEIDEGSLADEQTLPNNTDVEDLLLLTNGSNGVLLAWSHVVANTDPRHQVDARVLGDDFLSGVHERRLLGSTEPISEIKAAYNGAYGLLAAACDEGICFNGFDVNNGPAWLPQSRVFETESGVSSLTVASVRASVFVIFFIENNHEAIRKVTVDVANSQLLLNAEAVYSIQEHNMRNLRWLPLNNAGVLTWVEQPVGGGDEPAGESRIKALFFDDGLVIDSPSPVEIMLGSRRQTNDMAAVAADAIGNNEEDPSWLVIAASEEAALRPDVGDDAPAYAPIAPKIKLNLGFYDRNGQLICSE